MSLEELIRRPVMGVRPFNELAIDAAIWSEAHNQHHQHRYLHALAAHRPGIVWGLEVLAAKGSDPAVVVAPGVAVDGNGQTIVVTEPHVSPMVEGGEVFVTLDYQSRKDSSSRVAVGSGEDHYRLVEGYRIERSNQPPRGNVIELARVKRSSIKQPIKDAANAFDPQDDEINLLFRPLSAPHCYADAQIAELPYVAAVDDSPAAWRPNRAGLWQLMREGNQRGFHLSAVPFAPEEANAAQPTLLYVAGRQDFKPFSERFLEGLQSYLGRGGFLFGEARKDDQGFEEAFLKLFERLGAKLNPVASSHPLLTAHHVFSAPPPGARPDGSLRIDRKLGVLFSSFDYGGAWQGDVPNPKAGDARERIRQAQEFGLNVIAFAAHRRRQMEIAQLL